MTERADLDEHVPFLDAGQEPPGRWVDFSVGAMASERWEGPSGWRTRHGRAVVAWSRGKPAQVWSARCGAVRIDADHTIDFGWRHRCDGGRRWTYGDIVITSDEVVFIAGETKNYDMSVAGDEPGMVRDLSNDARFLSDLDDDRFARTFYSCLANGMFIHPASGTSWTSSDRQAAAVTAFLRRRGETYTDFFLGYEAAWSADDWRRKGEDFDGMIARAISNGGSDAPIDTAAVLYDLETRAHEAAEGHILRQWLEQRGTFKPEARPNAALADRLHAHLHRLGWARVDDRDLRAAGPPVLIPRWKGRNRTEEADGDA